MEINYYDTHIIIKNSYSNNEIYMCKLSDEEIRLMYNIDIVNFSSVVKYCIDQKMYVIKYNTKNTITIDFTYNDKLINFKILLYSSINTDNGKILALEIENKKMLEKVIALKSQNNILMLENENLVKRIRNSSL
jgi:hypothetical protein